MSHADMSDSSGFNEAAAAFSWNGPKKAINPYLDPAEVAPVSALSNLITLYAADNEQEQLRREELSEQVWERYFFNESRDPVQREWSRISSLVGQSWRMSSSVLTRTWSFWRTSAPSPPTSASR